MSQSEFWIVFHRQWQPSFVAPFITTDPPWIFLSAFIAIDLGMILVTPFITGDDAWVLESPSSAVTQPERQSTALNPLMNCVRFFPCIITTLGHSWWQSFSLVSIHVRIICYGYRPECIHEMLINMEIYIIEQSTCARETSLSNRGVTILVTDSDSAHLEDITVYSRCLSSHFQWFQFFWTCLQNNIGIRAHQCIWLVLTMLSSALRSRDSEDACRDIEGRTLEFSLDCE